MKTLTTYIAVSCIGIMPFAAAFAGDMIRPEEQIVTRQAGYQFMAWNMSKIKANLAGTYAQPQVAAAANVIASIANSGMGALYGPGTEQAIGAVDTRAKPEIFTDKEGVMTVARQFVAAANKLAEVAATGDAAAVKTAFFDVGRACKGCHDKYRAD